MPTDLIVVLILILIVAVVWRGPKTIPELGRMFGRGVREARLEANRLREGADEDAPMDEGRPPQA